MSHLARLRPFLQRIAPASRQFTTIAKAWIPIGAMKRGPKFYTGSWGSDNGSYMWVLMPGVPKENVTVDVVGNKISFKGTELLDLPGLSATKEDDFRREYKGYLIVDPARVDASKVKAEIVNGIFWLHIPNSSH